MKKGIWGISIFLIIIIFVVVLMKLTPSSSDSAGKNGWDMLGQEQMLQEMKKDNVTIVDLREPQLYKNGHIPGAVNIPFADFQDKYTELDKNKRIIFVCHDGPMGDASSQFLLGKGYHNLANFQGGMAAWSGPVKTSE